MDEIYIKRVLNNDIEAYSFLVEKYQLLAFHSAISIVKNESDASDVVQDSFIKAFEVLNTFKGDSKFSTWICRIVINNALKLVQKKKKTTTYLTSLTIQENLEYNNGIEKIESYELKTLLDNGLKLLAPKEALCVQLHYLEEFSVAEIEEITALSNSNIKVLLYRGRKNLYQHLYASYKENFKI